MKLENQICRLSQAKRLKELGVIQNQSFCFWGKNDTGEFFAAPSKIAKEVFDLFWDKEQSCAAFTVAELGIMLPYNVPSLLVEDYFNAHTGEWEAYLKTTNPPESLAEVSEDTEAEARAALLILILEVKEIDVDQVNERFTYSTA